MPSSVTPYSVSKIRCPSAVAPAWLPMAGTTNGRAPTSCNTAHAARTTSAMQSMPRLPQVTATGAPCGIWLSTSFHKYDNV
jgi:hypothetical protein